MLFVIDDNIVEHLRLNQNQPTAITTAIECIAHARRAGQHLIFAEREVLDYLRKYELFSMSVRGVYNKLYSRVAQDKAYFDHLSWRIRLVSESGHLEINQIGSQNEIVISAEDASDPFLTSPTIILSENQNDVQFYELVARTYMHWSSVGRVDLHYEARGGGGSTCATEYQTIQRNRQRLCLCVLDSDKKFPNGTVGDTLRLVQEIDDINQPLCLLQPLLTREIENLISTKAYFTAIGQDASRNGILPFLDLLERSPIPDARKYLDMKKGLRLYDVLSHQGNIPFYQYWLEVLKVVGADSRCLSALPCTQRGQCSCTIIPGMGSSVLDTVISILTNKTNGEVADLINPDLKPLWNDIGRLIVAWCGSGTRMSAS